ncbi:MAG: hypothetical protein WAM60_15715 [Candidatus Promineifilaceae bacterium]
MNECEEYARKVVEGPQSTMERMLLEEFLRGKGYELKDLHNLPENQVKELMTEACQYASLRMAQVESSAHFREKIRGPA